MTIDITVKVNNVLTNSDPIRITSGYPVINWDYECPLNITIDEYGAIETIEKPAQKSYELKIATSNENIGTNIFVGNVVNTGIITSEATFWTYIGVPLKRGYIYYCQIRITDEFNRTSDWKTFTFAYNSLCYLTNIYITPEVPLATNDIFLYYDFLDNDDGDIESGTIIRWYKNDIHQRQFDNINTIKSEFLQIDDRWYAEIIPSDGFEYGAKYISPVVKINKNNVILSNLYILPNNPNENDILSVDYSCSEMSEFENVSIRWFINEQLIQKFNDEKTIRYEFNPGDTVRYDITPSFQNNYKSSPTITILPSDFVVYNITIDGLIEPLDVSSISPVVRWKVHKSATKNINFVSVRIGTFFEASNIYEEVFEEQNKDIFNIPLNLLQKGVDYYVSVAVSDTNVFNEYASAHFRTIGSEWENYVNNETGWTIETMFSINPNITEFDPAKYQIIRFSDGTKFGEVRIYKDKIGFASRAFKFQDGEISTSGFKILTIVGQLSDIKIYLDKELILNATGLFTQTTESKKLEFGNTTGLEFDVKYKYFYYTTQGAYYPSTSNVYTDIKFHKFLTFEDNEIVSLIGYATTQTLSSSQDYKFFGVNPDKENKGSSIYAIGPKESFRASTVSRTFSPINKIRISPDGKKKAFAHAKGVSIISGYTVDIFDNKLDFIVDTSLYSSSYPDNKGWDLVTNSSIESVYIDPNGLNINTLL